MTSKNRLVRFFVILIRMKRVTRKQSEKLSAALWNYYDQHGRHELAWRKKHSAYAVVVSEIMLQQTQVVRVQEYFKNWMKKYPNWSALASASLRDVLISWQGLGYNRRGKYLHDIAKIVTEQYGGKLPSDRESLQALPGIGHYTAGSVRAFACNESDIFLETNIRTVLFYHLYDYKNTSIKSVHDKELLHVLEKYLLHDPRATENPREFYWAMMDYGSHLKQTVGNLNTRSRSHAKQTRFEGSRRQLRAQLLRYILAEPRTEKEILKQGTSDREMTLGLLAELIKEGSVKKEQNKYFV